MRNLVIAVALLGLGSSSSHAEATGGPAILKQRVVWKPTRLNYGKPIEVPLVYQQRVNNLSCDTLDKQTSCSIIDMPMIWQLDPKLTGPLKTYAKKFVGKDGKIVWAEPQFGTPNTPMTVDAFVAQLQGVGCYLTSITTVMAASLNDRKSGLDPEKRAADFDKLDADKADGLTKAEHQLLWQYERWIEKLQPNLKDHTQPSSPDFLELPEFAGDFAGNKVTHTDDNYLNVQSATVVKSVKQGQVSYFAYGRYQVDVGKPDGRGDYDVKLTKTSQHKVAISGYGPGAFPILINDVGDGKQHYVQVTPDWSAVTFKLKGKTIPYAKLRVDSSFQGTTAVIYEGAEVDLNTPDELLLLEGWEGVDVPAASK